MEKKGANKKGQSLSIGTLILIVLGIVVLVILILGFSLGWANLWEKINIFGGGSSIGTVVSACQITTQKYDYCQNFKSIKVDGKTEYLNCLDRRVAPNIDEPITCNIEQSNRDTSAQWYCRGLKVNEADWAKTIVNGIACKDRGTDAIQVATNVEPSSSCKGTPTDSTAPACATITTPSDCKDGCSWS